MFCLLIFLIGTSGICSYALGESSGTDYGDKISRGRILGNDMQCIETFEYFPETEFLNSKSEKLYKKTLKITKEFNPLEKSSYETAAQWETQLTFIYDKKSFVEVDDPGKNIEIQTSKDKWRVMDIKEVFPTDKICLVSIKSVLYKENLLESYDYIVDGHADVFCSAMGEIGVNTDLH
jgi:hypothetical protein